MENSINFFFFLKPSVREGNNKKTKKFGKNSLRREGMKKQTNSIGEFFNLMGGLGFSNMSEL